MAVIVPLSKDWTLDSVLGLVKDKLGDLTNEEIQSLFLNDYLHLNICETAKLLDIGIYQDYLVREVVTPVLGSPFYAAYSSFVAATSYYNATNTATKAGHGRSVGDLLVYYVVAAGITFGRIIAVTTDTFTVSNPIAPNDEILNAVNEGTGLPVTPFFYCLMPQADEDIIDISSFRMDLPIKLSDSGIGLCTKKNFKTIENILNSPQANKSIFWFLSGNSLILKKGNLISYGVLTFSYTRTPIKAVNGTDLVDIRDEFINLIVNKTALTVYEKLGKQAPESLNNAVSSKLAGLLQSTISGATQNNN